MGDNIKGFSLVIDFMLKCRMPKKQYLFMNQYQAMEYLKSLRLDLAAMREDSIGASLPGSATEIINDVEVGVALMVKVYGFEFIFIDPASMGSAKSIHDLKVLTVRTAGKEIAITVDRGNDLHEDEIIKNSLGQTGLIRKDPGNSDFIVIPIEKNGNFDVKVGDYVHRFKLANLNKINDG